MESSRPMTGSRSRCRTPYSLVLLLLIPILHGTEALSGGEIDTLDNEDVVGMTARGMEAGAIIRTIREAPDVEFDLDPEVVVELRRAGVAEAVIEAMRDEMRERHRDPEPRPPDPGETITGRFRILFDVNEDLDEGLNSIILPEKNEKGEKTSLAFYVFCIEPTHAPHMWQTLTPLSVNFTRHHTLLFHQATVPYKRGLVFLGKPAGGPVAATEGRHVIHVGVAARLGENDWLQVADAEGILEVKQGQTASLTVRLRTHRSRGQVAGAAGMPVFECEILDGKAEEAAGEGREGGR